MRTHAFCTLIGLALASTMTPCAHAAADMASGSAPAIASPTGTSAPAIASPTGTSAQVDAPPSDAQPAGTVSASRPVVPAASSPDTSRIDRITLSSGGIAQVHRVVQVQGDGVVRIDVPLAQVNDVLKSLLVSDSSGTLGAITLDGLSPVEETFATLPFKAASMGSLPDLLARLSGVNVRVASGGRTVQGAVLGVATSPVKTPDGDRVSEHRLSVLTEDKRIDVLRLGADATVDILDIGLRDRFATAVQALGRAGNDTMRTLSIGLQGSGQRKVELNYVTAAPVWKPAFRLLVNEGREARLQGWAVLENATGRDWEQVDLTLVSGAPVTFTQKLHDRYWRQRPELPVVAGVGDIPRADTASAVAAGRPAMAVARARSQTAARAESADVLAEASMPPPAAAPMATPSSPTEAASAQENVTNVSFHLPRPVTLARGQTLSVPFLDVPLPAERVSVFQPETGSPNPVSAVMLKNNSASTLPPGILTVYEDATGFVGDAKMPAVATGESRLVSFASDRKVQITSESRPDQRVTQIKVSEGVAQIQTVQRRITTYDVKGAADASRTVIIEHPRAPGWRTVSDQLDSETPTHRRLRVEVAAGANAKVEVVDELPGSDSFALTDADEHMLVVLAGAPATPELTAKLKALAQQRRTWAATERQLQSIDQSIDMQTNEQSRLRENLAAVPSDSELGKRYLDLLAKSENAIAKLADRRAQVNAVYDKQKEAFAQAIAAL